MKNVNSSVVRWFDGLMVKALARQLSNYPTIQLSNWRRRRQGSPSVASAKEGQVLIIAIVFFALILVLAAALFSQVGFFLRFGSSGRNAEQASALADAGVQRALYLLNKNTGNYYGDLQELPLGTTGTFFITVTDKSQFIKTIVSTGYVPNSINPKSHRTVKVDAVINSQNIAFHYAVQVGTGGVEMENSATINGTVYSNKTGTNSIDGSGTSTINGDAYAVGTISSPDPLVTGTKHPNSDPSQLPTVNYQQWKDAATVGGTTTCTATCSYSSGSPTLGPQKYVGNLDIHETISATLNGPIYVTGNLEIRNSASLKLNDSFGSNGTVIIVDGTVDIHNGGQLIPTSSNPKGYIMVVSTSTANPAVSVRNRGVNAIFYALDGVGEVRNDAQVTALVAKQLIIRNSATLNYDQGLASSSFSAGPGGSWLIKKGTYKFIANP